MNWGGLWVDCGWIRGELGIDWLQWAWIEGNWEWIGLRLSSR